MVKFRMVIILFNVFMVFFLAVVFMLPLLMLGKDMFADFWQPLWYLGPAVLAVIIALDIYFALNCRIYTLLEKEDWPVLEQELEDRVLRRGRYSGRLVSLLAATYLVLSNPRQVTELEKRVSAAKRKLVDDNALVFGAARILNKDNQGAVDFFSARLQGKKSGPRFEWLRWYLGFSQLLARQFDAAAGTFCLLAREGRDGIPAGLSSYFLAHSLAGFLPRRGEELRREAAAGRERVRRTLKSREAWSREFKQVAAEVHAAVLTGYMEKAADYLYAEKDRLQEQ